MKAPIKISITEPAPASPPSGVRDCQIEALKFTRDHTPSASQKHRCEVTLLAMGEKL